MSMDEVIDRLRTDTDELKKWVGVYVGVLAVLLAICSVGGANAAKDATRANIEAANTWAFYPGEEHPPRFDQPWPLMSWSCFSRHNPACPHPRTPSHARQRSTSIAPARWKG